MPIRHAPSVTGLESWGCDLHRPECVVGTASGDVFVPDWRGGVTLIRADGSQQCLLARESTIDLRPNGVALEPHGSFLIANLGDAGGVWRLGPDGALSPFLTEVDRVALPPSNFVTTDRAGRTWISVSTRHRPRQLAWRNDVADGFIVLVDRHSARIVADRLGYTNEVRPDPSGDWLYVVETFGRRLRRYRIGANGDLTRPEIVVEFGPGTFPDGFAFDAEGGIWITSLVSNRLFRLHDERLETMIEEVNGDHVDAVEEAFTARRMNASHLGPIPGTTLQHVTSLTFAGPDRRTVFLGSLHTICVHRFRSQVAGVTPV